MVVQVGIGHLNDRASTYNCLYYGAGFHHTTTRLLCKCGVQENDLTIAGAWNHLLGITMNKNFER